MIRIIDIQKARIAFKNFLNKYEDKDTLGFNLKVVHTYHVVENARTIAMKLNLLDDDIKLAELIALLHDIGRFEEITALKRFDSGGFDHATYGVKMLFEDTLIREFIVDDSYDEIIKISINNHNKLAIQDGLDERTLMVYETIKNRKFVDIHHRVTTLDYWVCVLTFIFDFNFKKSYQILKIITI